MLVAQQLLKDILGVLKTATTGLLDGAKMALATLPEDPPIGVDVTLTDYLQPLYTGYAVSTGVTWGSEFVDDDGNAKMLSSTKEFKPTADGETPETVRHVLLLNAAGDTVLAVHTLETPWIVQGVNDVLTVAFPFVLSQNSGSDPEVQP